MIVHTSDDEDRHDERKRLINSRNSRNSFRSDASHTSTIHTVQSLFGEVVEDIATLIDAETTHDDDLGIGKPIHTVAVVFNLANTTMGVGLLSLASSFALAGLILGPLLMLTCATATYFSVLLLVRVVHVRRVPTDASGVPSMEGVAEYCLGRWGKVWIQAVLIVICLGTLVAYLVSIKSLFYPAIKELVPSKTADKFSDYSFNDQTAMLLALLLVGFPLSLLRRLDGLWFTSFLSVLSLFYFVIISTQYLIAHPSVHDIPECHDNNETATSEVDFFTPRDVPGLFEAFSIISVSYICQLTVFPILKELAKGQRGGGSPVPIRDASKQLVNATAITMVIACLFYILSGVTGYLTWRDVTTTPSTILACYPPGDASIVIVYFGMTSVLVFSFPLICFTCRCTLHALIMGEKAAEPLSTLKYIALTLAITIPCAGVAYYAKSLSSVLGVVSALTSPSLCFMIPGFCYMQASKMEQEFYEEDMASPTGALSPPILGNRGKMNEESTIVDDSQDEVEFVQQERQVVRETVRWGYIVAGMGVAMQLACLIGVGFTVSGTVGDGTHHTEAPMTLSP